MLFAFPAFAAATPNVCDSNGGELAMYADPQRGFDPGNLCATNLRGAARVDDGSGPVEDEIDRKYRSKCVRTFIRIQRHAKEYQEAAAQKCLEIRKAMAQANSCVPSLSGDEKQAGYRECLERAKASVEQAKTAQDELIKQLKRATRLVNRAKNENQKALDQYRTDKAAADQALRQQEALIKKDGAVGAQAIEEYNTATGLSRSGLTKSVDTAANGGAKTVKEYAAINPQLQQEQERAIHNASEFQKRAESEISSRESSSRELETMKKKLDDSISKAGTPGISGGKRSSQVDLPDKGPVPGTRPTGSNQGAISDTRADRSGGSYQNGQNVGPGSDTGTAAGGGSNSSSGPSAAGGNYGAFSNAAGATVGGYSVPASIGGASSTGADGGGRQGAYAPDETPPVKAPLAYNFGNGGGNADGSHAPEVPSAEGGEDSPTIMANPYAGTESSVPAAELSGASVTPGNRETAPSGGKAVGVSTAGGGRLGSGGNSEKEIASREQFTPNLEQGAVSIAGSDVKSAVADLAAEFGATDLSLDLGNLSEEEMAALAPAGKSAGYQAVSGSRILAGGQEANDAAVLDEDSTPIFIRSHAAHIRAFRRGNLAGPRKKL